MPRSNDDARLGQRLENFQITNAEHAAMGARANKKNAKPNSHATIDGKSLPAQNVTASAAGILTMAPRAATLAPSVICEGLTMRLSDAGLRQHQTKLIYPDHRLTPCPNEAAPRDRSNRLLDDALDERKYYIWCCNNAEQSHNY